MQTDHWRFVHGKPKAQGQLKTAPEDFIVTEQLGYSPNGEGEHIYLWVEKRGLNTAFVAEQLAKFTQLPLRAVTYAGRKDKYALTRQWFAVHKPGKQEFNWSEFNLEGCKVLAARRHGKKLRTGQLKGNHFEILLRNITDAAGLQDRILKVAETGVPNYYGSQRFGDSQYQGRGGNLLLAEKMLQGEQIRNRNKRSMAISALRSWLFNEFVHQRIAQNCFDTPLPGDVMGLSGSNSFFVSEQIDEKITARLAAGDIVITSALWGAGELASQGVARQFEQQAAADYTQHCHILEQLKLRQERRAIRLYPQNLHWQIDAANLTISFSLPSGTFATSVLREILNLVDTHENIT